MIKKVILVLLTTLSVFANDVIVKESSCSVDKTAKNIVKIVTKKGLSVFAVIDHQANAKSVEMKLNESKVVIFGNPNVGTALMHEDITVGLDLPLKILVYKNKAGKVEIAYRDATWLSKEHSLHAMKKIAKVNKAMDKITTKAGQCKKD